MSKIIAVTGATGAQGHGVCEAILKDKSGGFAVRALTRNPGSEKARALAAAGAEVVKADIDDPASLSEAFKGCHGAFCVTFFWDHFSPEREITEAGAMAAAAKQNGLKHVIWSTLEDTRRWVPLSDDRMPTLHGKYKVPHFDGKGQADALFKDVPTTCLLTSFYWDNLIYFGSGPQKGPDGKLIFVLPMADKKLPGIAASDIGACTYGIFKAGGKYINKTVGIAGEHLSGQEMAAALTKALKQDVKYQYVPPEQYRKLGFPGADDLGNMFQFKRDFNDQFRAARSVEFSRGLNPGLQSFSQWLEKNASRIPLG